MYNALCFSPARSRIKTARVRIDPEGITVVGCDGYTIGQDWTPLDGDEYRGDPDGVEFHIDRTALGDFDSGGRADKKGFGRLEYMPGDAVRFIPSNNGTPTVVHDLTEKADKALWPMVDELMEKLERREVTIPEVLAFDPALLTYFGKVKTKKVKNMDRAMDLYISAADQPVLIKIGDTFTGALMPIKREIHRKNVGPEGLW